MTQNSRNGSPQLGRLESVDPRSIWPHEAQDFTPWLLANAEVLADTLGIDLELTENEHPVGGYSLDLLGTDLTNGCTLIVENQLTTTDHVHLGQLLTYAAGTDAATVVWIATNFREEHRQAVTYLNEVAGENARFFAVEINVVRIGGSEPAPLLKLVAEPNDWHATVSTVARAAQTGGGKNELYRAYWEKFITALHHEVPNWSKVRKPQAQNWMNIVWPAVGTCFVVNFSKGGRMRAELYIDTGDGDENTLLFQRLKHQRSEIETAFGGPLEWEELPDRRACRVAVYGLGDVLNENEHPQYIEWMIRNLTSLRAAFPGHRVGSRTDKV